MKRRTEGYVTLYLALTLGLMLSLVFTLIEGVRIQTIRMETESVMDIALFSAFGEYNRQLLEQYDLFFIDTTYGEGSPSIERTEEHIQYYMNQNFGKESAGIVGLRNLTELACDNVTLEAYSRASDWQGQVLMEQIIKYMKSKAGISFMEDAASNLNIIQANGFDSRDVEGEWRQVKEEVDGLLEKKRHELQEEQGEAAVEVSIDNPADYIWETRGTGILELALPPGATVSPVEIHPEYYYSSRQPLVGKGQIEKQESSIGKVAKWVFLHEYLFEKCGYYGNTLDKSVLAYQVEYIIKGGSRDQDNLREVLEDIFLIREAANLAYLFTSQEKQTQAELLATIISAVVFMPELIEAVKYTLLFAWSYTESVQDIRILLDGKKVPLIKDDSTWNTSLANLLGFTSYLGSYHSSETGMEYKDYLSVFLLLRGEEKVLSRFMDICEMDIRLTPGNRYFQMDGCLDALQARANITSRYGYGYQITRSFYY